MKIVNTDVNNNLHTLTLTIKDKLSYTKLINTLDTQNNNMQIYFENSNNGTNTSYTIQYGDIIGHYQVSNEIIEIMVKLPQNINNPLILNPILYTNIIIGDIMRTDLKDSYVLLDVHEFNKLNHLVVIFKVLCTLLVK